MAAVAALGAVQIFAWGSSFYFPAVLAAPIVADTGWPLALVVGGVSVGLLVGGLISPPVGKLIGRHGGRPMLAASSLLYAAGLAGIGLAPNVAVYLLAWVVLGLGMGAGLYDAVFAALGKLYGRGARGPITTLTLFGGFASTVCWPLSAFLVEHFGWRWTCFVYAAIHLAVCLPLQLYAMSAKPERETGTAADSMHPDVAQPLRHETAALVLIGAILTIVGGVGAIIIVHLLIFLQARGIDLATAVWFGTLFGPAQVAARLTERLFGNSYHPIWTIAACCVLMAIGLAMLATEFRFVAFTILLFGAGYGISWVARGTLPLALFGEKRFPTLMGRLAFPSLIAQALAPSAGAFLLQQAGSGPVLLTLTALGFVNVVLVAVLWWICRERIARA